MTPDNILAVVAVINAVFVGLVSLIGAIGQLQRNRGTTPPNGAPVENGVPGPTVPR